MCPAPLAGAAGVEREDPGGVRAGRGGNSPGGARREASGLRDTWAAYIRTHPRVGPHG